MIHPASQEFELPEDLLSRGFSLRPECEADIPFLAHLYASTREEELAQAAQWNAEQKAMFLRMQFDAQRHHYRTQMPDCDWNIILQDADAVGRLYLESRETQIHIVDIALMPQRRGQGVGTAILTALKAVARVRGKGLGIFVEKFNPALNLYRRLGFVEIGDTGVHLEMELRA